MSLVSVLWIVAAIVLLVVFCWRVGRRLGLLLSLGLVAVLVGHRLVSEQFDAPVQWLFAGVVVAGCIGIAWLLDNDDDND